jgi:fructose-specific phosphotransferase system IIC component
MPASLFLDWYKVGPGVFADTGFSFSGWDVFESTDAVMVLAALATLFLVAKSHSQVGRILMFIGAIATGFVAVAIADKPNFFALPQVPLLSTEIGAWLGLLGALLVLLAGVLSSTTAHLTRPGQKPTGP